MQKIGFIGAGNMAYAIISGLIKNNYKNHFIRISDTNTELLSQRKVELDVEVCKSNISLAKESEIIILAVKPQVLQQVCQELTNSLKHKPLIISIAAGVKTKDIASWLETDIAIIRTMPNTPALFNQGITGVFANKLATQTDKKITNDILKSIGDSVWVEDEKMMNAITAISGSGPAYFFLMLETMITTAMDLGFDEKIAQKLCIKTMLGSAIVADKLENTPSELRNQVTSPNGTTQAAIESFQGQNFELIVAHAVKAAYRRSEEIAREFSNDIFD